MTGFGAATCEEGTCKVSAEVRSVNHRYLKVQVKLPRLLGNLDGEIESATRRAVRRGSVTVVVRHEDTGPAPIPRFDVELASRFHRSVEELRGSLDIERPAGIDPVALLLGLPGVIREPEGPDSESETRARTQAKRAVDDALKALGASREAEGAHLHSVMSAHLDRAAECIATLATRAAAVPREYRDRLIQRVRSLIEDLDPKVTVSESDLIREIATFADRADVTEELNRLESHVARCRTILNEQDEVGRAIEFLLQEMLREANTVGSKANDQEIAHCVIDLKGEIERMKEQVQNLE